MIRSLAGIGLTAAAAALAAVLFPFSPTEASPAELVRRAGSRYLALENVELQVSAESEAMDLLGKLSDSEPSAGELETFRIFLASPNRFLVVPGEEIRLADDMAGFDGETFWSHDEEEQTILLHPRARLDYENVRLELEKIDIQDGALIELVSWGFIRKLHEAGRGLEVTEVTGPYERRVGHRAFVFDLRENREQKNDGERQDGEKERRFLEVTARVVIDPRTDLVEKTTFDISFGGLSLLTLRAELVAVNPGLTEGFFDYRTYAGPETKIRRVQETEGKEGEGEEENEDAGGKEGGERADEGEEEGVR